MAREEYKRAIANAHLYGILDLGYISAEEVETVGLALLDGGAGVLQLRAKELTENEVLLLLKKNKRFLAICKEKAVPFIVNDFPRVAAEVEAAGVHIGQDDGNLDDVRGIVGDEMLIGRSTHSLEQAQKAYEDGFDYIGFGPLFPTPTKQGRPGIGIENVAEVNSSIGEKIPVFCIGGIKLDNLANVLAAGARRVVIVSDLLQAADIKNATREVLCHFDSHLVK